MKRFLCLVLSLSITILLCFFKINISLLSTIKSSEISYEILDLDKDNQVVKINDFDLDKVCKNLCLEVVNSYTCEDRKIIEGYSNKLSNFIIVDGRKVNIQISTFDNSSIIGYPFIKNSF